MADIVLLLLLAGFFALAVLLVRACERIVGTAETVPEGERPAIADEAVAA